VITPRHGALPGNRRIVARNVATADAQQKLTITVVTQPFWHTAAVHQSRSADSARRLKAKSNGQIDVKLSLGRRWA